MTDVTGLSIIVPCYNERETVGEVIRRLLDVDFRLRREIIVVDDGSTDGTGDVVRRFHGVRLIRHPKNMGKGAAIRTGVASSSGRVIVIQDADMEYFPESIPRLIEPLLKGEADMTLGSRFLGCCEGMATTHLLGNRILSFVTSVLCGHGITDVMTGHKAFRREVFDSLRLTARSFDVETEIVAKAIKVGWRVREVPIRYRRRERGRAKISWRHGIASLLMLVKVRLGYGGELPGPSSGRAVPSR